MSIFRRSLIFAIIFQLVAAPLAFAEPKASEEIAVGTFEPNVFEATLMEAARDKDVTAARLRVEQAIEKLKKAPEGELPNGMPDPFHFIGQSLEVEVKNLKQKYSLNDVRLDLPQVGVDRDQIQVRYDAKKGGAIVFEMPVKNGVVRHLFPGFDVVTMARNKDLVVFVDASRKIYAIDFGNIVNGGFQGAYPVFHVGNVPESIDLKGDLEASFLTRGHKPFSEAELKAYPDAILPMDGPAGIEFPAGALTLVKKEGGLRKVIGIYHYSTMLKYIMNGTAVVAWLATGVSYEHLEKVQLDPAASELLKEKEVRDAAERARSSALVNPVLRDSLVNISRDTIQGFVNRVASVADIINAPRDRFLIQEWQESFEKYHRIARQEYQKEVDLQGAKAVKIREQILKENFGESWREYETVSRDALDGIKIRKGFYKLMNPKAMKILGGLTAAVAAGVGTKMAADSGAAWAVGLTNLIMSSINPVLLDAEYRGILMKSSIVLASFVPLSWLVGTLTAQGKGWGFRKQLAIFACRVYADIQFIFWQYAYIVGQKNFIASLRAGVNPWKKISKESTIGKSLGLEKDIRIGVNAPFSSKEDQRLRSEALNQLVHQQARIKNLAYFMANIAVSEKFGIPLPMLYAFQKAKQEGQDLSKIMSSDQFKSEVIELSKELNVTYSRLVESGFQQDMSQMDPSDFLKAYKVARETAESVNQFKSQHPYLAKLRTMLREKDQAFFRWFGNFSMTEKRFLKAVIPNDYVEEQFWKQFKTDYLLAVAQMAVLGDRANLSHPEALAADVHNRWYYGWTNPQHLADMADQVRIYNINVPARLALVYQKMSIPTDENFGPVEDFTYRSDIQPESFVTGVWKWTKNVLNPVKANYGGILIRSLKRQISTIQASFVMIMMSRMLVSHQPFSHALESFLFLMAWSQWSFGWMWMPVERGTQTYMESLEALNADFTVAKRKVSQGLRFNDDATLEDGFKSLVTMYKKYSSITHLDEIVTAARVRLQKRPTEDVLDLSKLWEAMDPVMELKLALDSVKPELVEKAYQKVIDQYDALGGQTSIELRKLNARSLLEFAIKNPPFRNAVNPKVVSASIWTAAILTTWYATTLSVQSFMHDLPLLKVTLLSAGLYTTAHLGQKAVNKAAEYVNENKDNIKARLKCALALEP